MNEIPGSKPESVWDLPSGLTEAAWFRDWDYYISSFTSLQKYWNEWQTWPLWNFHFCGGRPELANPQNWTLTWLHPFIYLFEPVYLILTVWFGMTLLGGAATALLVRRETASTGAALLSGAVYALSGYFGAHFNQGVFTFAFFHFIPFILLLLRVRSERPTVGNSTALFLVSVMFFTAALPHGLFYFYPACVIFVLLLYWQALQVSSLKQASNRLIVTVYPHVFAAGAALYKLLPAAAWQRLHPRTGVHDESLFPTQIFANLIRVDSDYDNMLAQAFEGQFWFLWEYNAYIGLMPLAAALLVLFRYRRDPTRLRRLIFPGMLVVSGILLASGNEHWASPGYWFRHLPLVSGIRVFGRYQILIVFGIALIAGFGFKEILDLAKAREKLRAVITALLIGLTLVPLLLQNALHIKNIRGVSFATLGDIYQPPSPQGVPLLVAMQGNFVKTGITHHDYLLRRGGIVANCYDPLTLARPKAPFTVDQRWLPLSVPEPQNLSVTPLSMALGVEADPQADLSLYLTEGAFPVTVTDRRVQNGDVLISAQIPGLRAGIWASACSFLAFLLIELVRLRRR